MKHHTLTIISLLSFLTACSQPSATLTEKEKIAIDRILVMDVPDGAPGLALGIVRDGKIIYENYAGYGKLDDSTKIGPHSRFNIASNGKQFTALTILELAHYNKLDLDEDIRTYLPGFLGNVQDKITIRSLLNHTSGIRDFYDLWSLQGKTWWEFSADNQDVAALLKKQKELNFKTGSKYLYSNSNYVLLAGIIEKVSGHSFTALTRKLFNDLGMEATSFEPDYKNITGPVANPYFNFDTWTTYDWISNIVGDGALFSTLPDQLQWEKIIQTHKSYPISADIVEKSQNPIPGSQFTNYGFGIEFDEYLGKQLVFHTGSTGAWKAATYRFPEKNLSIVALTNSGKVIPSLTVRAVARVLFGEENQPSNYPTEPATISTHIEIDDIIGTYQNIDGFIFRFVQREGELYLLRNSRNDTKLVRESANIFHQWNDIAFKQEFVVSPDNKMEVTAYYTTHAPYTLTKIEADFTDYDFAKLEGIFINVETEAEIEIRYSGNEECEVNISGSKYSGQLLKPTLLKVENYSIHVSYKNQRTEQLLLGGERIKNVSFQRK